LHRHLGLTAVWSLLAALTFSLPVHAAAGDTIADRVLGQHRFGVALPYFIDGTVLDSADIAIDRSATPNHVYIASPDLDRVLGWSDIGRFRAGAAADLVLGQPWVFNATNSGDDTFTCAAAASATTFCRPIRVAVDPAGNLYVADAFNFRVLEFDRPFATDRVADRVFGQRNFTARKLPAVLIDAFNDPLDIAVDAYGDLWMIDPAGSGQIFEFDTPPAHDTLPDRVIAPATADRCLGASSQAAPCSPYGIRVSPQGDLYVQDRAVSGGLPREVVFQHPLTTDLRPDFTLILPPGGQPPVGVFNSAGALVLPFGRRILRYPAPIGPETQPEIGGPLLDTAIGGRPALDSQGNLYVANNPQFGEVASFIYVVEAPFGTAVSRVGRQLLTPSALAAPVIVAVDRSASPNHLYAVDAYNRVLGWRDAEGFANGDPADLVLPGSGQTNPDIPNPNCFTSDPGPGQFCPYSIYDRGGLAVDSRGNLWMADAIFNRVLEFDRPFESDGIADRVLGQGGSFHSQSCNLGGLSARSLCSPGALAFDGDDHLYVADLQNHRVLLFEHPLADDTASKVFGQPDFTQGLCNQGHRNPGAATLCLGEVDEGDGFPRFFGASSVAVDPRGNLYVADMFNNRVLIYRDPRTSDAVADQVLGQPGFQQRLGTGKGPGRFTLGNLAVAVGPAGELYVADPGNNRVLEFPNPLQDATADRVFGHADFTTGGLPFNAPPPPPTASNLLQPMGVAVDAFGNLFVADTGYDRVLRFDRP
jgi:DNA-binding beta-propeller fold protein YncE